MPDYDDAMADAHQILRLANLLYVPVDQDGWRSFLGWAVPLLADLDAGQIQELKDAT